MSMPQGMGLAVAWSSLSQERPPGVLQLGARPEGGRSVTSGQRGEPSSVISSPTINALALRPGPAPDPGKPPSGPIPTLSPWSRVDKLLLLEARPP